MKTIPIIGNDSSFLYRFLVSPRLRLARPCNAHCCTACHSQQSGIVYSAGCNGGVGKPDIPAHIQFVCAVWFSFLF